MDAKAIVEWAEAQTPTEPPRKKTGAAAHIQPDERREIQIAHLTEGLNQTQLARRFERTREAVAGCLKGAEFEALQRGVQEQLRGVARQKLEAGVERASDAWVRSVDVAAAKGDHRPAKDLLQATGIVERDGPSHNTAVQIVIGMPGSPAGPDPFAGFAVVNGVVQIPPGDAA